MTSHPTTPATRAASSAPAAADAARPPRGRRWLTTFGPVLASLGIFLVAWQAIVVAGSYPPFILPGPLTVAQRFVRAWTDGTMWPHFATTLVEVLLGFAIGATLAIVVGVLLARSRLAERLLSPYLVAAQATPILALAPLIALWFGTGLAEQARDHDADRVLPGRRRDDGRAAVGGPAADRDGPCVPGIQRPGRAAGRDPGRAPAILGGMRVGVTLAVIGAIIAEWAGGERGLGVLINVARGSLFDIPLMFATLATLALLGVTLYLVMVRIERRLVGER